MMKAGVEAPRHCGLRPAIPCHVPHLQRIGYFIADVAVNWHFHEFFGHICNRSAISLQMWPRAYREIPELVRDDGPASPCRAANTDLSGWQANCQNRFLKAECKKSPKNLADSQILRIFASAIEQANCFNATWCGSSVWLECRPVTPEVEGSSPFRTAVTPDFQGFICFTNTFTNSFWQVFVFFTPRNSPATLTKLSAVRLRPRESTPFD